MINFWAQAKWVIQNKGTAVFTKSVRIISKQIFNYLKKKKKSTDHQIQRMLRKTGTNLPQSGSQQRS